MRKGTGFTVLPKRSAQLIIRNTDKPGSPSPSSSGEETPLTGTPLLLPTPCSHTGHKLSFLWAQSSPQAHCQARAQWFAAFSPITAPLFPCQVGLQLPAQPLWELQSGNISLEMFHLVAVGRWGFQQNKARGSGRQQWEIQISLRSQSNRLTDKGAWSQSRHHVLPNHFPCPLSAPLPWRGRFCYSMGRLVFRSTQSLFPFTKTLIRISIPRTFFSWQNWYSTSGYCMKASKWFLMSQHTGNTFHSQTTLQPIEQDNRCMFSWCAHIEFLNFQEVSITSSEYSKHFTPLAPWGKCFR